MSTRLLIPLVATFLLVSCATAPGEGESTSSSSSSVLSQSQSSLITVSAPQPNATITSPLIVTGEARGNWYFEASFPVRLLDGNNQEIARTVAQAQGDWMTTDFVPFTATLTFTTPSTTNGTLVLEKDNPSGEPQNADSISIPVQF